MRVPGRFGFAAVRSCVAANRIAGGFQAEKLAINSLGKIPGLISVGESAAEVSVAIFFHPRVKTFETGS